MSLSKLVLVTGPSGYVGAAVTLELIRRGYRVRGTVRSQNKADVFVQKHPHTKDMIEWSILPDIAAPHAFDSTVKGVDYIIHVASPFHYETRDNEADMLRPAIEGTKNIFEAALTEPKVQRVVVTGSTISVMNFAKRQGHTYTEEDWNPIAYEAGVETENKLLVYAVSKTFAEKTLWHLVKSHKPHFSVTVIAPPEIFGPVLQPVDSMANLNRSALDVWAFLDGSKKDIAEIAAPKFVDVRDVATMHVDALSNPKAANQRYLCVSGDITFHQAAYIIAENVPGAAARVSPSDNRPPPPYAKFDTSKAERDFGMKWTSAERCFVDMAESLFALEQECHLSGAE